MSGQTRIAVVSVAFFLVYALVFSLLVVAIRCLWVSHSLSESVRHCIRHRWHILLFASACTGLFVAVDTTIAAPLVYYIVPGMSAAGALVTARGSGPTSK